MADNKGLVPKTAVELELEKAKIAAKQERETTIGTLLDKAAGVLSGVLDSTDDDSIGRRMRAAEIAINLYIQQENGARQERALDIQQKRLELEEEKLRLPGGALFQQNNVYLQGQVPQQLTAEESQAQLLARKKAQDAILATYLPQKAAPVEQEEIKVEEVTEVVAEPDGNLVPNNEDLSGDKPE